MSLPPRLLLLVSENDHDEKGALEQSLAPFADLTWARDFQAMSANLLQGSFDAAFCAGKVFMQSWRDVLDKVHDLRPDLPVIMMSETARETDSMDVLNAGGFELL